MTYPEKLKDPRWQKKRLEVLDRDGFCCSMCKNDKLELQVHHKSYRGINPWDTPLDELTTLCRYCQYVVTDMKGRPMYGYVAILNDLGYMIRIVADIDNQRAVFIYRTNGFSQVQPELWVILTEEKLQKMLDFIKTNVW